jgi:hypothetical protein
VIFYHQRLFAAIAVSCPPPPTGVANWSNVTRIIQKGLSKKVSGRTNQWPNRDGFYQKRPKKCKIMKQLCCLYYSIMNESKVGFFSQIFILEWFKNWYNFNKTRDVRSFLQRDQIFFLNTRIFWLVWPDCLGKSWQHCLLPPPPPVCKWIHFRLLGWQINLGKFSCRSILWKNDKCFGVCIVN